MSRSLEYFALGLAFASVVPYIGEIIWGLGRPHKTTWFVWFCVNLVAFFVYRNAPHATNETSLMLYASAGIPFFIFLLSLWKGEGGTFSLREKASIAVACVGGVTWGLFGITTIGLLAHASAHFAGSTLTIEKAWRDPHSESLVSWGMSTVSWIIVCRVSPSWPYPESITTIYLSGINALVMGVLITRRISLWEKAVAP